jgi:2-epi-5-epi-valiolone synthase
MTATAAPAVATLHATVAAAFRIEAVPGLFEPGNRALADAWGPARRLLVVRDGVAGERADLLAGYLRAAQARGELVDFLCVDADSAGDRGGNGMGAYGYVVEAAVKAQLGRRDAVVAFGGQRTGQVVAVAAASFRRHTAAVRIHRDLAAMVSTVRDGLRVTLDGEPVAAFTRQAHVILDEDGVRVPPPDRPDERVALLLLALLDRYLLDRLDRAGVAGSEADLLAAVLRQARRLGPGHPAWRLGEDWLPLAPEHRPSTERRAWSLLAAARVAGRLGLLPAAVPRAAHALAGRLELLGDPAGVDTAAADRWLAGRPLAGDGPVSLVLPMPDGGAEQVTIDVGAVVRALADLDGAGPAESAGPAGASPVTRMTTRLQLRSELPASFPVRFVSRVLDPDAGALADLLPGPGQVLAVVDPYARDQRDRVERTLAGYRERGLVERFAVMPVGATKRTKAMRPVTRVLRAADELGLGPGDRLIVIGGGTLMDIVGYAAYLYRHDTPYVRVPTTLVGMIDAGVGLKVGVNLNSHKSLLGAYHPPLACLCDVAFLRTLPPAELRCGLAEAIKMAVVCDAGLFDLIERHHHEILAASEAPVVREILHRSIVAMLHQLSANPLEEDLRRLPDFGHEFGHALESISGYRLRHGEAVAIGMALSCRLATATGHLPAADLDRILRLLTGVGLAVYDPACDPEVLWRRLHDEVVPHKAGRLHLVVPRRIGAGDFIDSIDEISLDLVRDACAYLSAWSPT